MPRIHGQFSDADLADGPWVCVDGQWCQEPWEFATLGDFLDLCHEMCMHTDDLDEPVLHWSGDAWCDEFGTVLRRPEGEEEWSPEDVERDWAIDQMDHG